MGWFGMPGYDRKTAFEDLFSQHQYKKKFELLWEKQMKSKSIGIFTLDGKIYGQTILWYDDDGELAYKPISWADSIKYIPKKYIKLLLENATELEKECYEASKKFRLEG